jgi:hypothetical protein
MREIFLLTEKLLPSKGRHCSIESSVLSKFFPIQVRYFVIFEPNNSESSDILGYLKDHIT